jgi:hypothetical protein
MISILISHPTEGLILFETGGGKDYPSVWGLAINDIFARVNYTEDQYATYPYPLSSPLANLKA